MQRSTRRPRVGHLLTVLIVGLAGCGRVVVIPTDGGDAGLGLPNDADPVVRPDGGPRQAEDAGLSPLPLSLVRVSPDFGPYTGGGRVLIRGAGLERDARVTFGGVAAMGPLWIDAHRLEVTVPPGMVGPVDVVVAQPGELATLPNGYTYTALAVEPSTGASSGGTWVVVTGAGLFEPGDTLLFGGAACLDLVIASASEAGCRTPPGPRGPVDVALVHADGSMVLAPEAFTYTDLHVGGGGLDGGPIAGTVDVVVLGAAGPVEGAFVMLGEDAAAPHRGRTDASGHITFSEAALRGPVNLHVTAACYNPQSFIGFDARRVTLRLAPRAVSECPASRSVFPRDPAVVRGELIWGTGPEPGPWPNVPAPGPGERRAAYVMTTRVRADLLSSPPVAVEETSPGTRGYTYQLQTRAGVVAVYALAGVATSDAFTPHVMGVARGVVTRPGVETSGVDLLMDIPLDRSFEVRLTDLPPALEPTPGGFSATAYLEIDEGVIYPELVSGSAWSLTSTTPSLRFTAHPRLAGALADARYTIEAEWGTGWTDRARTVRYLRGLRAVPAELVVDDLLDVPTLRPSAIVGSGLRRRIRWSASGANPDLQVVTLTARTRFWQVFVRGDLREAPIPDLSAIEDVLDGVDGLERVSLRARSAPGLDFDRFRYSALDPDVASHEATRSSWLGAP